MKLKVIDTKNKEVGDVSLPAQFSEDVRPDLVKRAVLASQSNRRQPYGAHPMAGKRASAELSRRRHNYKGSYGHGISRVPRKIMTRRGTRFFWVGAFAPGTVGGRRAHAPKAQKIWSVKLNVKERRKAIRSAMSAVIQKEIVEKRGHKVPANYPFVLDNSFEKVAKTKDVSDLLKALGFGDELKRDAIKKVRAGRGKARGRKYKTKIGPLLVVSDRCELEKAARNLPGVEVRLAKELNAESLAPGADIGRLTLFTQSAIEKIDKENLFA